MNPDKIAFEKWYTDDSGVEYGVRYDALEPCHPLEIEGFGATARFSADQLDWLIGALDYIRRERP